MAADIPCGYCDVHEREPAVVVYTGPETGQKKKRMCKACWKTFREKTSKKEGGK
jgi:hypothetical protein